MISPTSTPDRYACSDRACRRSASGQQFALGLEGDDESLAAAASTVRVGWARLPGLLHAPANLRAGRVSATVLTETCDPTHKLPVIERVAP